MRIRCICCGKVVSTEVPEGTVVRAFVECPECIESNKFEKIVKKMNEDTEEFQFGGK